MKGKLFRFQWGREAVVGLLSGSLMVLLSCAMALFPNSVLASVILRDVLMIFTLGFVFPLCYVLGREGEGLSALGIHGKKWKLSLLIDVVLALALWMMFSRQNTAPLQLTRESFYAITYIFAAGVFEMVFIYGFLRCQFQRAFGTVPAILLTAAFYSLHHAGFQPEFTKLFFVGVLYATTFFLTGNLLVIFPFFWGVGAVWDVLAQSQAGEQITNATSFGIAICLLLGMGAFSLLLYRRGRRPR